MTESKCARPGKDIGALRDATSGTRDSIPKVPIGDRVVSCLGRWDFYDQTWKPDDVVKIA